MENASAQSIISGAMQKGQNDMEQQRRIVLEKKKERARSSRMNETAEQRQIRLEDKKKRAHFSRATETEEQRQIRLENQKKRDYFSRATETEEQRQIRLDQQRERSQANRAKKKLGKRTSDNFDLRQQSNEMHFNETEEHAPCDSSSAGGYTQNENITTKKQTSIRPSWPEPISRDLKVNCLQQYLQQMSMRELAEATCAVCNVRTPVQTSKQMPVSKIPHINLLKVSDELKDLITINQSSVPQQSNRDIGLSVNDNNIQMTRNIQSNI
jgi:hypothetical protein